MTPQKTIEKITPNCKVFCTWWSFQGFFVSSPNLWGSPIWQAYSSNCWWKNTILVVHLVPQSLQLTLAIHRCPQKDILNGRFGSQSWKIPTVDGRNPAPVEVGSFYHYLQGFIHPRWCRISFINGMLVSWNMFTYTSRICFENPFFCGWSHGWVGFLVLLCKLLTNYKLDIIVKTVIFRILPQCGHISISETLDA